MSLLFETIKLSNGVFENIPLHHRRMNNSRRLLLGCKNNIFLKNKLEVPADMTQGIWKCRVDYDTEIRSIKFEPYVPRRIERLRLVECNGISYPYKYSDRSAIEALKSHSASEEILIVKNGLISDTSFSNIIFYDGTKWVTPITPLLNGVRRQQLLNDGVICEHHIFPDDLKHFTKARLINAMLDITDGEEIPIGNIGF
jgi:4-amino-4-deoxychorismate lyase